MVDTKLYWTGIVYFVGLFLLGVVWWKALIVGIVALICWYLNYSRQIVLGVGMVALCLGLGFWVGLLPTPSQWGELLATLRR